MRVAPINCNLPFLKRKKKNEEPKGSTSNIKKNEAPKIDDPIENYEKEQREKEIYWRILINQPQSFPKEKK